MFRVFLIVIFLFCFCIPSFANTNLNSTQDTLLTTSSPTEAKQYKSIESTNEEQLSALIDSLFQMDVLPLGLINEIKLAIARLNNTNTSHSKTSDSVEFPSSEFYSCWEIDKLFPPQDMLKMKGDTSIILTLNEKGFDDYFHPFNGSVTSDFGWRDSAQHNGVDIHLNRGDKIAAAFDGKVRFSRNANGYGNVVIIRHYNGLETVYAHLSKIKVKPGQVVIAGQVIGLGGSTGISTAPHLHFEVRFKGAPLNPKYLISFPEQKLLCNALVIKNTRWGLTAFPKDGKIYTIEKGDTLFGIAKHFGTSTKSIKEINGFTSGWVKLKAGQKINVMQ